MKVLHISSTPLSGAVLRLSHFLNKYSGSYGIESKALIWQKKVGFRYYGEADADCATDKEELNRLIYEWADILHFHNHWKRHEAFRALGKTPPAIPSVIQMHSPRESENFGEEVQSKLPIACPAQYHPRQWPEKSFIIPNVIDIYNPLFVRDRAPSLGCPVVSYAPSNTNALGWNNKSYSVVNPVLKRMSYERVIGYQLIHSRPFEEVMLFKRIANIGVDEISTGSYHLSTLEYLSLGIPCFANTDALTDQVVKDLTGCSEVPWIKASKDSFERILRGLVREKENLEIMGVKSRGWMESYWNPEHIMKVYVRMYDSL